MDIRKYEVIIKAAECGNLTKAGESFGYTQSGVSHMIKGVEEEFGFRIFLRSRDGVKLTPDGERVLPILREIAKWNESLGQTVSAINGVIRGVLRIGSFTSIAIHWLPKIIRRFQRDYPNISIDITEGGISTLEGALEEGAVDLTFMSLQPGRSFDRIHLRKDPFLAILPEGHPRAQEKSFPLEAFNGEDFILVTHGFDYDTNRLLKEYAITPKIKFTSHDDHTVFSMVENGLGVSILPELVMRSYGSRGVALPLEPAVCRDLALCVPSFAEASPACRRFIEYVKKMVAPDGSIREYA
ncbi:MAG: LysR family transcriptional regulator [bacterium]|nr:LysR family transcriptional regulator [bacterium]